ncbi:MAG: N-acetyl-gamma-glutamyl-phosphate reductase [Oscillospiraceae bacterium]|jgi:N-acetyl-gamma-glutamyl-phosphate reductase|nr:N-acetyl-gamma-glutamyl-phosphate reductase [Oscillospiraceae bacterium]
MIKAGIIGATGYAGAELCRLLAAHPQAKIAGLSSRSFEGKALSEVYPAFLGKIDQICQNKEDVIAASDVVFACLPHGHSEELALKTVYSGKKFIDLGADFRLADSGEYKEWYGKGFEHFELHLEAAYGLPELFREELRGKKIIANPGCYPTSVALALFPALKSGLAEAESIIIDSKSGVTGAGRELSDTTHFPNCNEAFSPYKIAAHRHTPEIEQTLSRAAGKRLKVTFVPHLLPINRGILSTCYVRLKLGTAPEKLRSLYEDFYRDEPFVRVMPEGQTANLKNVRTTNLCDISLHADRRTGTLIAVAAIDNMVKGAAGQAVQNMNLLFGLPETTGLELIPAAF